MALAKCRECGADVSSKAKKCPHCGISNPTRSNVEVGVGVLIVLAVVFAVATCSGNSTTTGADSEKIDAEWLRQYGDDPQALDKRFSSKAQAACSAGTDDYLRSMAAHDFAWDSDTEGLFGVKFDKFGTNSAGHGLLTLISNRAKLSNGFGAFSHIELYCLYDAGRDNVVRYSQADPALDVSPEYEEPAPIATKSQPIVVYSPSNEGSEVRPKNGPATVSDAERGAMPENDTELLNTQNTNQTSDPSMRSQRQTAPSDGDTQ